MTKQELKNYLSETVAQIKDELELTAALSGKEKARSRWLGVESLILNFVEQVWGEKEMDAEWVGELITIPTGLKLP